MDLRNRRVLVTGASGFIGSHVCERLIGLGASVVGVSRNSTPAVQDLQDRSSRFRFISGDVTDLESVRMLPVCDEAIHLAGPLLRGSSAEACVRANTHALQLLIETLSAASCRKFSFASSAAVYDDQNEKALAEDDPVTSPMSLYAASKRSGELLGLANARVLGVSFRALRLFTVYGPRQQVSQSVARFTAAIANGDPIYLYGEKSKRDYVHVDDVSEAFVRCSDVRTGVFNVGTGVAESCEGLVDMLSNLIGRPAVIVKQPAPAGDPTSRLADTTRAKTVLGFVARTTVEEGLSRYVRWWREHYR